MHTIHVLNLKITRTFETIYDINVDYKYSLHINWVYIFVTRDKFYFKIWIIFNQ